MDNTIHVYIIFHFPITYRNASEGACIHQTVNPLAFFTTYNENTYSKGRALMQMDRVVP